MADTEVGQALERTHAALNELLSLWLWSHRDDMAAAQDYNAVDAAYAALAANLNLSGRDGLHLPVTAYFSDRVTALAEQLPDAA